MTLRDGRLGIGTIGGGLAQLGEHNVRNVGVGGSSPLPSTRFLLFEVRSDIVNGADRYTLRALDDRIDGAPSPRSRTFKNKRMTLGTPH